MDLMETNKCARGWKGNRENEQERETLFEVAQIFIQWKEQLWDLKATVYKKSRVNETQHNKIILFEN